MAVEWVRDLAADSPRVGETSGYRGGMYDAAEPKTAWDAYQDYGHNHWANSLFCGEGQHGFAIYGRGMIWGRGLSGGAKEMRVGGQGFIAEQAGVGNKAIALKNCRNVLLRDFSVLKGGHFAVLATGVDNLTIDNVLVDTDRDGFDIDCCRNVRVVELHGELAVGRCDLSEVELCAGGKARSTDNVTICELFCVGVLRAGECGGGDLEEACPGPDGARWHNGRIKCGTESNGGFRNIAITNCVLEGSKGISLESSDGALIEDVAISNVTMRGMRRMRRCF